MIPKNIIYIWFGKGEKGNLIQQCIDKNKQILEEWDFQEFTEDNYDISSYKYMEEAYQVQKYAFASDCARFDILYRYGGVYVDTDVEFLKSIPEDFLTMSGFCGIESNCKIAPGLVFACEPGNSLVKEILDSYKNDSFIIENKKYNERTVVDRVTEIFKKHGYIINGKKQVIEGFHVYPCEYFCAYDFVTREFEISENTYSIHHYTATWTNPKSRLKRKTQDFCRKILGKKIYRELIKIKRKFFGISGD